MADRQTQRQHRGPAWDVGRARDRGRGRDRHARARCSWRCGSASTRAWCCREVILAQRPPSRTRRAQMLEDAIADATSHREPHAENRANSSHEDRGRKSPTLPLFGRSTRGPRASRAFLAAHPLLDGTSGLRAGRVAGWAPDGRGQAVRAAKRRNARRDRPPSPF